MTVPRPDAGRRPSGREPEPQASRPGLRTPALPEVALPSACRRFFDRVVDLRLVAPATAREFIAARREQLERYTSPTALGAALVEAGLLTAYQASRVLADKLHGLVLGNYRVLDRLGAGGMAVVFEAEHVLLKRRVAVKVLPVDPDGPPGLQQRFYAEMRVLAELHHPNVVLALDAGDVPSP